MMPACRFAFLLALALLLLPGCRSRTQCRHCAALVTITVRQAVNDSLLGEERIASLNYFKQSFQDSITRLMEQRSAADRKVSRQDSLYNCEMEEGVSAAFATELEENGWYCQSPK